MTLAANLAKTQFQDRYFIFVPLANVVDANKRAAIWDFDIGGDRTFGNMRLSANGKEPATHTGCATKANPSMKAGITDVLSTSKFSALYSERDGWIWQIALKDIGLKVIEAGIA